MRSVIIGVYDDIDFTKEKIRKDIIEDAKTIWLINRINEKLPPYYELAMKVTQKTEELQLKLWNIVVDNIAKDLIIDPKAYITDLYNIVIPS
jgi:hypothetical protein